MSSFLKSHGVSSSSSNRRQQQLFDSLAFSSELTSNPDTFRLSTLNDGNAHVRGAAPAFGSSGLGTTPLIGFDGELSCVAFDPLQSLLAVGTKSGQVSIYGEPRRIPKCSWQLRPSQAVKHLVLKSGTSCVVVIDAKDTLHIFDLADLDDHGQPNRLIAHSLRSSVNCIEYVPQLSHVFLGCQDGTVETFDVDRVSTSPYRIRNLWLDQDELLRRSGVHNAPSKKRIPACTDLKTHPLDASQLLLAYEGGIVLYSLPEQVVLRVYEYLVLPGAPGGHNDQSEAAFLERRPGCTCLAWRPDGKIFAAGYDDGTVVFWSVDDGDRPVMARTLSMDDVNLATSSSLFGDNSAVPAETQTDFREPIFKLAWSSFTEGGPGAKGSTILTVLGGLLPDDPKGLHCLHLPPYVAPSLLSSSNASQLREGLRASVKPNYRTIIPSDTPPEDFTLLTANPHLGQSSDPFAVFMLLSADPDLPRIAPHTERGFAALDFPPAPLSDPKDLTLPMEMQLVGNQTVLVADAVTFPSSAYRRLRPDEDDEGTAAGDSRRASLLPLTGGDSPSTTFSQLRQPAPAKRRHTPPVHHGILTAHLDMSIRLWDCSNSIPELLDTFSARDALSDDQLGAYLEGRILIEKVAAAWETTELALGLSTGEVLVYKFGYAKPSAVLQQQEEEQAKAREEEQILLQAAKTSQASSSGPHHAPCASNPLAKVDTSRLDVEMAAAASSMSVGSSQPAKSRFFGRKKADDLGKASSSGKGKGPAGGSSSRPFEVDLIDTAHYSDWTKDGYKPVFTLSLPSAGPRGDRHITALGLSDAGFLAVAWGDRLAVVDLRGPEVLFSEAETVDRDEQITSLTWAICAEGEGPERHPRLIVLYSSGLVRILTLSFTLDTWIVNSHAHTFQQSSLAKPVAVHLLDPFGNSLTMTGTVLDDCLRRQESSSVSDAPSDKSALNTLLVVVSEGGLTVKANLTGERLLRREFGSARAVSASVVKRYGMPVLVVIMHDGSCVVFSLPKCEEVKSMRLSYERSRASMSIDGRILQSLSPTLFQYSTLFADQALPAAQFAYHNAERLLPAPPAASYMAAATSIAASYVSSWFGGSGASAAGKQQGQGPGSELDDLLGGPKRPAPRLKPVAVAPVQEEAARSAAPSGSYGGAAAPTRPARVRPVQSGSGTGDAQAQARMPEFEEVTYNKFGMPIKRPPRDPRPGRELVDALEQRGERLGFLNEHLDNASKASQDFVSQAKKMAVTQGAKGAVTGVGKGISLGINKMLN